MTLELLFWLVYIVALVVIITRNYRDRIFIVNNIIYWILFAILGFGIFGSPVK